MFDAELARKMENILERKLTPDEWKFLRVVTQLLRPKRSRKPIPQKANVKAA